MGQQKFVLIENHSACNKLPAQSVRKIESTKQIKARRKNASAGPRLSRAELRRIEREEQEAIRKEAEKERAARRNKAARERKKAQEEAAKLEKRRNGLPLVDVNASQAILSNFFRAKSSLGRFEISPMPQQDETSSNESKDKLLEDDIVTPEHGYSDEGQTLSPNGDMCSGENDSTVECQHENAHPTYNPSLKRRSRSVESPHQLDNSDESRPLKRQRHTSTEPSFVFPLSTQAFALDVDLWFPTTSQEATELLDYQSAETHASHGSPPATDTNTNHPCETVHATTVIPGGPLSADTMAPIVPKTTPEVAPVASIMRPAIETVADNCTAMAAIPFSTQDLMDSEDIREVESLPPICSQDLVISDLDLKEITGSPAKSLSKPDEVSSARDASLVHVSDPSSPLSAAHVCGPTVVTVVSPSSIQHCQVDANNHNIKARTPTGQSRASKPVPSHPDTPRSKTPTSTSANKLPPLLPPPSSQITSYGNSDDDEFLAMLDLADTPYIPP